MELQLKVKHFIKVLSNGDIKITNFVDSDCGCAVEQAAMEQFNVPIFNVDEGIIRLEVLNNDVSIYYHELYDGTRFHEDLAKAKLLINEQESVIRILNLTKQV